VGTEFDGSLRFELVDRIPNLLVSSDFSEKTARQIRYALVATVGPERPFYHRYPWVVLDVRMVGEWLPGSGEFVGALQERLRSLNGELYLVTTRPVPVADTVPRFATREEATAAAKDARAQRRAQLLQVG